MSSYQRASFLKKIIHLSSLLWDTILGGNFRYAATIAPGWCDDAAPDRRDPGCVLGRFEVVPCLRKVQELPQRRRGTAGHEHHADAQDRPARRADRLQIVPARSKRIDAERRRRIHDR